MFVMKSIKNLLGFFGALSLFALLALISPVLAGGGEWKMGPFGPYWNDNDWPEFTPMYWMEEFLNRIDDDDEDIQDWMQNQQLNPSNNSQRALVNPYEELTSAGLPNMMGKSPGNSSIGRNNLGYSADRALRNSSGATGDINNFMNAWNYPDARHMLNDAGVPELSRKQYLRMPENYQKAYQNILRNAYLANGLREQPKQRSQRRRPARNEQQMRQQHQRYLMSRKRKKTSACFLK